ncbi:MAG: enoyl-CoA hydratase/isomerase family protein [Candidatus Bathyarchaeota archaeon]|nr:enoyl-CoA hydratase/isomerase family protein [Candidatus Bathyarchaeota archaeon]
MEAAYKNILYESVNETAKITINKPPLNVLNVETLRELTAALDKARNDTDVKTIIITGAGNRAFCAGVDVRDHFPDKIDVTLNVFHKVFHVLVNVNKPVLAVVNGFALGGGCELAMACDIVIASETAKFGQPEINVGAIPTVATALLPKLVGRKKALELILTGDTIDASEAAQIGLVNKVVPSEKLEETSRELVNKLTGKSSVVTKLARMATYQGMGMGFLKALENVTGIYVNLLMRTEDAVEGLNAFIQKRKPEWKGK